MISEVRAGAGRYAPSPSGDLHLGNLRTALLAWLFARSQGRRFLLRIEDIDADRSSHESAERQLADLAAIGLDWDAPVLRQSDRRHAYTEALNSLSRNGHTFECFCSRKDILAAPTAPHGPPGSYPGTCRDLTEAERARRPAGRDRPPSIRLRSGVTSFSITDLLHGEYSGPVDDFVLMRFDGTPAYNLVSIVDDAAQGVGQVVRGDDLLPSTPRQAYLASLLRLATPDGAPVQYAHVPLALNAEGKRLAKRDGAVTLADLAVLGRTPQSVLSLLAVSLGLAETGEPMTPELLLSRFSAGRLPREPWIVDGSIVL